MVHIPDLSDVDIAKERSQDHFQQLEALLSCVQDLESIEHSIDIITARFQRKTTAKEQARRAEGWLRKESSRYPGRFYYMNAETGETSWKAPKLQVSALEKRLVPAGKGTPAVLERASLLEEEEDSDVRSTDVGSSSDSDDSSERRLVCA